jgi:hypothetical protein
MRHFKIDGKYGVIDIMKDKSYKYGIEKSPPTPPTPPFLLTVGNSLFVGDGLEIPLTGEFQDRPLRNIYDVFHIFMTYSIIIVGASNARPYKRIVIHQTFYSSPAGRP